MAWYDEDVRTLRSAAAVAADPENAAHLTRTADDLLAGRRVRNLDETVLYARLIARLNDR